MSENHTRSVAGQGPARRDDLEFLEVFCSSPNMELWMAKSRPGGVTTVAKRLPVAYRDDPTHRYGFRQECEYLQALRHPGVSRWETILDMRNEIVQILVPGSYLSIRQLTELSRRLEQRLPAEIGLFMIEQILLAMRYIGERAARDGHTDLDIVLHPDALLVDQEGRVVLTRVGLFNPPYITSSILRTENKRYFVYAAPEQCVAGRVPDKRASFYTLGMLSYELLTGQPLFSEATIKDLDCVVRRKVRLLHPLASDVDPKLACVDDLIMGLLDPLPECRATRLDSIIDTFDGVHALVSRCGLNDIISYRNDLENKQRAGSSQKDDADVPARLSAVTDIAQYNAS